MKMPMATRAFQSKPRDQTWAFQSTEQAHGPEDIFNMKMLARCVFAAIVIGALIQVAQAQTYRYGYIDYKPGEIQHLSSEKLVEFLRADGIRGNAVAAMNELWNRRDSSADHLNGHPVMGLIVDELWTRNSGITAALETALDSPDWQQRQMAAEILRGVETFAPTDRLLEVTMEGLRDDGLPFDEKGFGVFVFNAFSGTRYLLKHPQAGTEILIKALESDDSQQRFLAAYVLGATGRGEAMQRIAEILMPHLQNDDVWGNACMAVYALYHLGPDVTPFLEPYRDSTDEQQRQAVQLVRMDLDTPPRTEEERLARRKFHTLSELHPDPCVEEGLERYVLSWNNPKRNARLLLNQ